MSEAKNEYPPAHGSDFPMQAVRHLADGRPCRCQTAARHVEQNIHWPTCIVGQAQAFLGRKVTFCDPNSVMAEKVRAEK